MAGIGNDHRNMTIDPAHYPYLFAESTWTWGPVKTVFQLGQPPPELVSNVNIVPFDDVGWLAIRQQIGWGIVGGLIRFPIDYLASAESDVPVSTTNPEAGERILEVGVFSLQAT